MKKIITILIVIICIPYFIQPSFANDNRIEEKALEQQQRLEQLFDKIKNDEQSSKNDIEDIVRHMRKESTGTPSLESFEKNLRTQATALLIKSRKYIIPAYMILIILNIINLSVWGSRSLRKRKMYIKEVFFLTIFFLIILNLPLVIFYFNVSSNAFSIDRIYNSIFKVVFSLRDNSIVISLLVFIYGLINIILGKDDYPRHALGSYLIKSSLIILVTLQAIPVVVSFIM